MSDIDASHHIHVPKAVLYYYPQSAWSIAGVPLLERSIDPLLTAAFNLVLLALYVHLPSIYQLTRHRVIGHPGKKRVMERMK
jgi:hypothetical protein